jgi:hypothetical protein
LDDATPESPRVPLEAGGIQVNFCKNPACPNFAEPPGTAKQPRGRDTGNITKDTYIISGAANEMFIQCKRCNECPPLKSNIGILEELQRFLAPIFPQDTFTCSNPLCENHAKPVLSNLELYWKFGKSRAGSQRYRCKTCKAVINKVVKTSTVGRHKRSEKNADVFLDLVNKTPLKPLLGMT